nr:sugar ABC transporter permease [uncultured Gemmiger sp.]
MPATASTAHTAPVPKRGMKKSVRESLIAYSFIAPNFIGFCVFTLVPMFFAICLAFCDWDGAHPIEFVGLQNFIDLLDDETFKASFVNTIVYTVGTVPLTLICSLGLAVLLNQKVKFRNFFRTVSFFPYVASLVAVAAVWNMIFSPSMGPVNQILAALGVENLPRWAAGKETAMITVILFSVWKNMGYYMVIYLAGLQGTNLELNEAAELDGANKWQIFWHVVLPQLRPTTFFVVIMLTISSFKVYDQMYMITQGGPGNATMTLVYDIYNVAFVNTPRYGYASAISMVLFVLVLIVTLVQFRGSSAND